MGIFHNGSVSEKPYGYITAVTATVDEKFKDMMRGLKVHCWTAKSYEPTLKPQMGFSHH